LVPALHARTAAPILCSVLVNITMPELPEVESFRRLLLPLVSTKDCLRLERHTLDRAPPRKFLSDDQIREINDGCYVVTKVLRKGKLICLVLTVAEERREENRKRKKMGPSHPQQPRYLFVHMGMTGRISTPHHIPKLVEVADTTTYPPSHTYLRFVVEGRPRDDDDDGIGVVAEACFSDPRKFGSVLLKETMEDDFGELAPDAWALLRGPSSVPGGTEDGGAVTNDGDVDDGGTLRERLERKLANQSMGIKAQLLDQKRIVSGVGNWVADEVLYQCRLHPDQDYLTDGQARQVMECLGRILDTAVHCLTILREEFPSDWLFHYRWSKGKASSSSSKAKREKKKQMDNEGDADDNAVDVGKDAKGRTLAFVTSGGRTSAIVPTIQKKKSQKPSQPSSLSSKKPKPPSKGVSTDTATQKATPGAPAGDDTRTAIGTAMNPTGTDQDIPVAMGGRKRKNPPAAKSEKDALDGVNGVSVDAIPVPKEEKPQPRRTRVAGTRRSSRLSEQLLE
jgi:formamidopyrimidine-DNA glycosylase